MMRYFTQIAAITQMNFLSLSGRIGQSLVMVCGIATTVAVFVSLLAIGAGLEKMTSTNTRPDMVIVQAKGAASEFLGTISEGTVSLLDQAPGVQSSVSGQPLLQPISNELVEVTKKSGGTDTIRLRGTGPMGREMMSSLKIVEGRNYETGVRELIVGKVVQSVYENVSIGDTIELRGTPWKIVGVYEDGGSFNENGFLADAGTVLATFNNNSYPSVEMLLESPEDVEAVQAYIDADPRLDLEVKTQESLYQEKTRGLSNMIGFFATFIGSVMALGAVATAASTMNSLVESRVKDIATLRAIGFRWHAAIVPIVLESLLIAIPAALIGAAAAWLLFNGVKVTSVGLTFPISITAGVVMTSVILAVFIGLLGSISPCWRASRLSVSEIL